MGELVFYDQWMNKELLRTGQARGSYITLLRDLGKRVSKKGNDCLPFAEVP